MNDTIQDGWGNGWCNAESERAVMVAEFQAWVVKTRFETEKRLLTSERHQRDTAPFAQAGLDGADTPQDVPLCVLEFAHNTLEVMDLKRKLALLNVYYRQAANRECDVSLVIEEGTEAEVNELWKWFVNARKGEGK